ncbi:MAG: TolC family protein [Vicinamibacterales bacterium]
MRTVIPLLVAGLAAAGPVQAQTATPVTLAEALDLAVARSPLAAAAAARVDAAREHAALAGRLPNPAVELRSENWAFSGSSVPEDFFAVVTAPIELGGERGARRGAAAAGLQAADAATGVAVRQVRLDVTTRFFDAVRAAARADALAEAEQGLAELVRVADRRVAEGLLAEAGLRRLEAERARVAADRVRAEADRLMAAVQLAVRLGLPAVAPTPPATPPPPLPSPAGAAERADVRLARAQVEGARQALRFQQALGVPDLAVSGGYKRTAGYNTGVVAVTMAVPVFGRNGAAIATARGDVRASELELDQATLAATSEAAAAAEAARALAAGADGIAQALVTPASQARDAARSAFLAGAADLVALVDAERSHTDARLTADGLRFDAWQAAVAARLAAGEDPLP